MKVRSPSAEATLTIPSPVIVPVPRIKSIPLDRNICSIPERSLVLTSVLRAWILPKSKVMFSAVTPNCSLSRISFTSSAECISVLVGIQPRFRQVPPTSRFSTTAVLIPSCAARMEATYPPGPPPITTTSVVTSSFAIGEWSFGRGKSRKLSGCGRSSRPHPLPTPRSPAVPQFRDCYAARVLLAARVALNCPLRSVLRQFCTRV